MHARVEVGTMHFNPDRPLHRRALEQSTKYQATARAARGERQGA